MACNHRSDDHTPEDSLGSWYVCPDCKSILRVRCLITESDLMLTATNEESLGVVRATVEATFDGFYAYTDFFGRLVFDTCPTDQAHLAAETPPGQERRRCRKYVEDLLPQRSRGKRGRWVVKIDFVPDESTPEEK